jgi:hypothetical protein
MGETLKGECLKGGRVPGARRALLAPQDIEIEWKSSSTM